MFKNRAFQIRLVKTTPKEQETIDMDKLARHISSQIMTTVAVAVAGVVTIKIVYTICKIAVNVTNPTNWK